MKKWFLVAFLPLTLLVALFLSGGATQAYDPQSEDCGMITGLSDYRINAIEAYRSDYENGYWTISDPLASVAADRATGSAISDNIRLCPNPDGELDNLYNYTWIPNTGWLYFSWCNVWGDPATCATDEFHIDMNLEEDMAYTGDAYWYGKAWGGIDLDWVWFDWDANNCNCALDVERRVHTDLTTGEVVGWAWSDTAGWIRFGNRSEPQYAVYQDLPEEVETRYVQPVVTISPDPSEVTKYGAGGGSWAPFADGDDSYLVSVALIDADGDRITEADGYDVDITITPTEGSFVYMDQISRPEADSGAVVVDDPVYINADATYKVAVHSWAPTSGLNGYDQDGDGAIDYPFDRDPDDLTGFTRADDANQYFIDSIDISITNGPGPVEVGNYLGAGDYPTWNLSVDDLDLEFEPAVEVMDLVYLDENDEGQLYLPSRLNEAFVMDGMVKVWSTGDNLQTSNLQVGATLNSTDYYYLFDNDGNLNYVPGEDTASANSTFSLANPGELGLDEGGLGAEITNTMLVDVDGYLTFMESPRGFFANLFAWINPFRSLPAKAQLILAQPQVVQDDDEGLENPIQMDVAVNAIFLDGNEVVVQLRNQGSEDISTVDVDNGYPQMQVVVDGTPYLYGVACLLGGCTSYSNTDFFYAGSESDVYTDIMVDAGETVTVGVYFDPIDFIEDDNVANNAYSESLTGSDLPDLAVTDIQFTSPNQFDITLQNLGAADASFALCYNPDQYCPIVHLDISGTDYEVGSGKFGYDSTFMSAGGTTVITYTHPQQVNPGSYNVMAWLESEGHIAESDYSNNSLTIPLEVNYDVDADLLYETTVYYREDTPIFTGVHYYSAYLALESGPGIQSNVPAHEYKLEPYVSGSITSSTADLTLDQDTDIVVVGDISTTAIRNELYQRFSQLTRGVNEPGGGYVKASLRAYGGQSLLDDALVYYSDDVVVYDVAAVYESKTIVVQGGDIYLDGDLTGSGAVGLVAFKDAYGNGGNIYIHPDVTDLVNVTIFADGSVLPYDGEANNIGLLGYDNTNALMDWVDVDTRQETLVNQLYFAGSIISSNTMGGHDAALFPNGETAVNALQQVAAREYDLYDLREFTLCWVETDEFGTPVDQDGDGGYEEWDGSADLGDMEECDGYERAANLDNGDGDLTQADNTPFYIEYVPPSADLPLVGEFASGGLNF